MFYKPEIREKMLRRRKQLDVVSMTQAAQAVAAQVLQLSEFLDGRSVACYLAVEGELDPLPIMHCAHTLKKQLYLPAIIKSANGGPEPLQFLSYRVGDPLIGNGHGIGEPDPRTQPQSIAVQDLDVIFLPLVAFDVHGNRLGRGAGHYDRTLAFMQSQPERKKPYLIGLAYAFQKVPDMTPDKWDVPMDIVVTEKNIYHRNTI